MHLLKIIPKLMLILGVLAPPISLAAECEKKLTEPLTLGWTQTSNSVQATLWRALYDFKRQDEQSQYPQGYVNGTEGQLSVSDGKESIQCQSRSAEFVAVQQYQCEVSTTDLPWTLSSKSIQGVLFEALYRLKMTDDASHFPQGYVRSDGGSLIVEDDNFKLTCISGSPGPMPVRMYRCQFERK